MNVELEMKVIWCFLLIGVFVPKSYAQDSTWTLQQCIDYAMEHNLTIQQSELDNKLSEINLNGAKMSYYPTLSASSNYGVNLGRSINPTTNQFENTRFSNTGLSASSNVLLFGWFQKRYAVQKSELQLKQTNENYEQLKDDIALNISTAYLRALLANEQVSNVLFQIDISKTNKERIEKLLKAGKSNILEVSQSATQLATDSSIYFQAILNYEQSLIELKTLLHLDYSKAFYIDTQAKELALFKETPNPETIYSLASNSFHSIKASEYAEAIAAKDLQITKASSLPQLNLYYSTGTNYSSSSFETLPNGETRLRSFGKQANTNLSQSVGLGLNIPIFNNFSSRNSIKTSKISFNRSKIASQEAQQKLKQAIYTACTDYQLTLQKFQNAQNILKNAQTAYEAAHARYEAGLIAYFEFLNEKNNYLKSQNEASALKFDLWFKKMLVERF